MADDGNQQGEQQQNKGDQPNNGQSTQQNGQHAGQQGQRSDGQQQNDGDKGFPENTPVAEMTDKQAAAYWRDKARKHEQRADARKDYDELKSTVESLRAASQTDQERAVEAAKAEATTAGRRAAAPQIIAAEFRAAGVPKDDVPGIVEPLSTDYFLNSDGSVDTDKVSSYAAKFVPATGQQEKPRGSSASGLGSRQTSGQQSSVASGAELWKQRHPSPATA